jgi:arylsulfatase A-like enzyme
MWLLGAFATAALLAAGAAWLQYFRAPVTMTVVDRLFARDPSGTIDVAATPNDSVLEALATRATRHWTADDITRTWTRVEGPTGSMLRSPALDLHPADPIEALVIQLKPAADSRGLRVLWSNAEVPTWGDYGRARREVQPRSDGPSTVIVEGTGLYGERGGMPRYLFLAQADRDGSKSDDSAPEVASVAVVTVTDRVTHTAAAQTRITAAGDTRDAFFVRTPGQLAWEVTPHPGAELALGVHVPAPTAAVRLRINLSSGGRDATLYDSQLRAAEFSTPESPAWHDVRLPLALAATGTLRVSLESDQPGGAAFVSAPAILAHTESDLPNIVLYVVSSLRADRIGTYGKELRATPFLNRLAREGLVFEHAYASASWAKPAVTSLLTGLHPATHRIGGRYYSDQLPGGVRTLQSELRASGYVTAQFSGTGFTGALSNLDRGFDRTLGPAAFADSEQKIDAAALHQQVLPWITAHQHDRFFAYVQAMDTHPPYEASQRDVYDATVTRLDAEMKRLYDHLEQLDLKERTLLIVTGDHGEALGDHGKYGHGLSVYDEEVRVPLIVHWPGRIEPKRSSVPLTHVDLMPTVLDYAGIPLKDARIEGRSVAERDTPVRHEPIFVTRFTYPDDVGARLDRTAVDAVIDYPWKLIATGATRIELYNLDADPRERTDIAPSEPEQRTRLAAMLRQFLDERAVARTRLFTARDEAQGNVHHLSPAHMPFILTPLRLPAAVRNAAARWNTGSASSGRPSS